MVSYLGGRGTQRLGDGVAERSQPSVDSDVSEKETFALLSLCDLGMFVKAASVNYLDQGT